MSIDLTRYWDGNKDDEFSNREVENLVGFKELIELIPNNTSKILDCSCGIGNLACYLTDKKYDVVGLTYNQSEVDYANHIGRHYIIQGDMHTLSFDDNTFDFVYSIDALEHCQSPYIALQEMKRVLKPNGKMFIFMPGARWIEYEPHLYVLNIRQMKWLIHKAGLNLENIIDYWGDEQAVYYIEKCGE